MPNNVQFVKWNSDDDKADSRLARFSTIFHSWLTSQIDESENARIFCPRPPPVFFIIQPCFDWFIPRIDKTSNSNIDRFFTFYAHLVSVDARKLESIVAENRVLLDGNE